MPRLKKRADGRYQRRKVINGKSVVFYGKSQNEIDEKIASYERRVNAPLTFAEIAQEWKDERWDKLSVTTQNGYHRAYERAVECFGDMIAVDITPQDINIYLSEFIRQDYALKTVQTQKGIISTIFRYAISNGRVKDNPASKVTIERGLKRTPRDPPSEDDINKILYGEYDWLLPRILIYTGLRRGEVLALTWEDFDRVNGTIRVNKTIVYQSNRPILKNRTKTAAGTRHVPIPAALARYLPSKKHGNLFDYDQSSLRRAWDRWAKELGVTCTMHQLRHAYASILLDAGVEAKDAQKVLGHSDVNITQNIYTHILASREKKTINKINAYFAESSNKSSQNPENA